jgi:cell division protein FtsW
MSEMASSHQQGVMQRTVAWFSSLGAAAQSAAEALPVRIGSAEYARTRSTPAHVLGFDQVLLWVTVSLLAFGVVMVYSASIAMPDNPRFSRYTHTHF